MLIHRPFTSNKLMPVLALTLASVITPMLGVGASAFAAETIDCGKPIGEISSIHSATPEAPAATPETHRIEIILAKRKLFLYEGDKVIKTYPVGVGRPAFPTPKGSYKVTRKIPNPHWENPYLPAGKMRIKAGNGNPLGTRWIGFKPYNGGEYGIHGTYNLQSVGRQSSHGCVRMFVKDVEELYDLVDVGTPVEVKPL